MTMPKFKPVAYMQVSVEEGVDTYFQRLHKPEKYNADWWRFDPLHSADQLIEAYEAGKREQADELEAARAEIERKMSAGQFVLEQLADEQAKNVGLRELVEHFALIDLGRSLLPDDFGLWVLRARKALSTPADLSTLRAHDAAIWREAMQIAEDSRDKATMSKYSSVPECRAARDMAECLSKAYCHKADTIEK